MAIFGAPVAHEDDPERAVRAALAIREELAADGDLEVHIGVTTGEALITLDARIEKGERTPPPATASTPPPAWRRPHRPAASSSTRRLAGRPSGRSSSTTRLPSWPKARATRSACGARSDPARRWPAGERATHRSLAASGSSPCSEGRSIGSSASASRSSSPSSESPESARRGWCRSWPATSTAVAVGSGWRVVPCRTARAPRSGRCARSCARSRACSTRTATRGPRARSTAPSRRSSRSRRRPRGSNGICGPWSASIPTISAPATAAARPSPPGGGSWKRWRRSNRSSSSSTTCIGRTTHCLTS